MPAEYQRHGRRHAADGEDPIPAAAASLPVAIASAYSRSMTMSGLVLDLEFDDISTNDASFGYESVTSGRAKYVTISKEGWYRGRFVMYWNSDFTAGDFPFIQPQCLVSGSPGPLVNSPIFYLSDERNIANNQSATAEMDRHVMSCTLDFIFTSADFGDSVVGIGLRVVANNNRTKNFGGYVELVWLGDTPTSLTIT